MDFSASALVAGLLVSTVGFALYRYGRKQERPPQILAGLVLMVFPYFAGGATAVVGIAAAVLAALWVGVRAGL